MGKDSWQRTYGPKYRSEHERIFGKKEPCKECGGSGFVEAPYNSLDCDQVECKGCKDVERS